MRFVLAPDSFKESMTAQEVADAMERGIKKVIPEASCIKVPMADGGEGTAQSLIDATNGKMDKVEVKGPKGNLVEAELGKIGEKEKTGIEMASANRIQIITTKNFKRWDYR